MKSLFKNKETKTAVIIFILIAVCGIIIISKVLTEQ